MDYKTIEERICNDDLDKKVQMFSDTLYHYTSLPALIGMIMEKKEIWFGEASLMNDTKELTDFIDRLRESCIANAQSEYLKQYHTFFQKIYSQIDNHYPYIISFQARKMMSHSGNDMPIMQKDYVWNSTHEISANSLDCLMAMPPFLGYITNMILINMIFAPLYRNIWN